MKDTSINHMEYTTQSTKVKEGSVNDATIIEQFKDSVSAIIPAYNEAERIKNVVIPALESPFIREVIVIDDGSSDGTSEVIKSIENRKLKLIVHRTNKGKTIALKDGIDAAKSDYVIFIDADLRGLTTDDVNRMIIPVVLGKVDITLGNLRNSLLLFKLTKCDFITGERCLKKELLRDVWKKENLGFGIEVLLNQKILKYKLKFKFINLEAYNSVKIKKRGFIDGMESEVKMFRQMTKALPVHLILEQYLKMSYLNKRYQKVDRNQRKRIRKKVILLKNLKGRGNR